MDVATTAAVSLSSCYFCAAASATDAVPSAKSKEKGLEFQVFFLYLFFYRGFICCTQKNHQIPLYLPLHSLLFPLHALLINAIYGIPIHIKSSFHISPSCSFYIVTIQRPIPKTLRASSTWRICQINSFKIMLLNASIHRIF